MYLLVQIYEKKRGCFSLELVPQQVECKSIVLIAISNITFQWKNHFFYIHIFFCFTFCKKPY